MSISENNRIIAVVGPTSSGKSDLAVKIALYLNKNKKRLGVSGSEIISADSRQIYKDLNVGSGKITKKETGGIPHHLLSISSPRKIFSVSDYQKKGTKIIKGLLRENKIPIICGGTGLYVDSLINQSQFPNVPPDPKLRRRLSKKTTDELFAMLSNKDPKRAKNIDKKNKIRLIRALEIIKKTGKPIPPIKNTAPFLTLKIGIKKDKKELKRLIEKRTQKMLRSGLVGEVKKLIKNKISRERIKSFGFEYFIPLLYINGEINKKDMEEKIVQENLSYAKRQMTWFKRDNKINWVKNKKRTLTLVRDFFLSS